MPDHTTNIAGRSYSVKELAEAWGISTKTIYREIKAGRLACLSVGPGGRLKRVPDWARRRYEGERLG